MKTNTSSSNSAFFFAPKNASKFSAASIDPIFAETDDELSAVGTKVKGADSSSPENTLIHSTPTASVLAASSLTSPSATTTAGVVAGLTDLFQAIHCAFFPEKEESSVVAFSPDEKVKLLVLRPARYADRTGMSWDMKQWMNWIVKLLDTTEESDEDVRLLMQGGSGGGEAVDIGVEYYCYLGSESALLYGAVKADGLCLYRSLYACSQYTTDSIEEVRESACLPTTDVGFLLFMKEISKKALQNSEDNNLLPQDQRFFAKYGTKMECFLAFVDQVQDPAGLAARFYPTCVGASE